MIDLEFIAVDEKEIPQTPLEWHERQIPFNTVFLYVEGPNPITGEYMFTLTHLDEADVFFGKEIHWRDKNGKICHETKYWDKEKDLKRFNKLRTKFGAVELNYRIVKQRHASILIENQERIRFTSLEQIKDFIAAELVSGIRRKISKIYPSPVATFKFEVS